MASEILSDQVAELIMNCSDEELKGPRIYCRRFQLDPSHLASPPVIIGNQRVIVKKDNWLLDQWLIEQAEE